MEVSDARQAFLNWNKKSLDHLIDQYEPEQQAALTVIPLLFQTNDRLLPGYNGPDIPAGIYGYIPAKTEIDSAKQFHAKFRYKQERALNVTIIESVFIQRNVIDESLSLWIIHIENLKSDQIEELRSKLNKIILWLKSRRLYVEGHLIASHRLAKKANLSHDFIDHFYLESCLYAGKYPVWWLVPPEKEDDYDGFVDHIKTARFVNEQEYLDIGHVANYERSDLIKLLITNVQDVYKRPEYTYLNLLLMSVKHSSWPDIDGLAWRVKSKLYLEEKTQQEPYADDIVLEVLEQAIDSQSEVKHKMPVHRMFNLLAKYADHVSLSLLNKISGQETGFSYGLNVVDYLSLYKALFSDIRSVYNTIVDKFYNQVDDTEANQQLVKMATSVQDYLSEDTNRVPIYNVKNRDEMILGRILLRHIFNKSGHDVWALVLEQDEGDEKVINGFTSLLALISWAWLNRIVDQSTQVSIDCPKRSVKQVEAHHVLSVLIRGFDQDFIHQISNKVFEREAQPINSLLFISLTEHEEFEDITDEHDVLSYGDEGENLITDCEQIIGDSWGEVYTRKYTGHDGVLQCLCDWMNNYPLTRLIKPAKLHAYGYSSGESTYIAQRIGQVYEELLDFFYEKRQYDGRFILLLGDSYNAVQVENEILTQHRIGNRDALFKYFERANVEFCPYALERLALADTPLKEILERNKKNVVQIFYQVVNQTCDTYVLDEKGSLWHRQHQWFDHGSFIAHWLYLMRSIRNRLKKINYQDRDLPTLEIQNVSVNQIGGLEFYAVGSEAVTAERGFIDLQVEVAGGDKGDNINLVCDGRRFEYEKYGDRVIAECVQHISARMKGEGRKPVYVTDIEAPLRLYGVKDREHMQVIHFLKYKRNIENMLNQMLFGYI